MKLCPKCANLCRPDAIACDCGHEFPKRESPAEGSISRRINGELLGSFICVCVGWLTLGLAFAVYIATAERRYLEFFEVAGGVLLVSSPFVFGSWLLIFVPIYLFVPSRSILWRWPVCMLCGAVAGAVIMYALGLGSEPAFSISAAVVGGVTCLFASLTRRHFKSGVDAPFRPVRAIFGHR